MPTATKKTHLELQNSCFHTQLENPHIVANRIEPNDYAHQVLQKIGQTHDQILISNTNLEGLPISLEAVRMQDYFQQATAVDSHINPNQTKREVLEKYLTGKKYEDIVIIGDSPKDISLKEVAGGTTYLYTHPGKPFRDCEADWKIHDLREILKEVE